MSLPLENFDYDRPENLEQLAALVTEYEKQGRKYAFAAGGTNIIPVLKVRSYHLDNLISLTALPALNRVEKNGPHIAIGALTTLDDLANHDLIQEYLPALAHAAHTVANPQIRNRATIGGNIMVDNRCSYINQSPLNRTSHSPCFKADGDICHIVKSIKRGDMPLCQARFVSDTAPVLLLLKAMITIVGPDGLRKIKLRELYLNDGIDSRSLRPGEVITSIDVDIPEQAMLQYEKLTIRNALDFPSLGVAVRITGDSLSIALTGINIFPGVFEATATDYDSFDHMVTDICAQAMDFAKSYNQDFFPRGYRKDMIPVFIRRGVKAIIEEKNR